MKVAATFFAGLLLLAACARLPALTPAPDALAPEILKECGELFPQSDWQLVHRIKARLPNGRTETLMGISQIFPRTRRLHCVLMTIEGLVLLEAQYDYRLEVHRAVPPFDRPGVAEGMLADIGLLFLAPQSSQSTAAVSGEETRICRYHLPDNKVEEIAISRRQTATIQIYDHRRRRLRSITFESTGKADRFAGKISLKAHGLAGYQLDLTLIEAQPLTFKEPLKER